MSRYQRLSPRGVVKTVAICDRCRLRFNLVELSMDGDDPALLVCPKCSDEPDPYKRAPRKAETIAVRRTRPDVSLAIEADVVIPEVEEPPSLVMNFITDFYSVKVD